MIHLPQGVPVRENVNPARINLPEAMGKLRSGSFSGYLSFKAERGTGIVLFQSGRLISSIYANEDESQRLIAYDAIAKIFKISILGHVSLNIYKVSPDLILYIHALLHGRYMIKGKNLSGFDVGSLLEQIQQDQLTACLRVYATGKTALIFYEQGIPLGFFHEGSLEIQATANLKASVAALPQAKLDALEVQNVEQLVLADLMGSADLHPIWQRTRKALLEEQSRREENAMRSSKDEQQRRRQQLMNTFKTIAGTHIGKFGVTQVEKAFSLVGPEVKKSELEHFYLELQRLARLVASQGKINDMVAEMRQRSESPE